MRKLIDIVNKTRQARRDFTPKAMTMAERDEVLQVHPDYAPGGKRQILFGPNKGDMAANEVVDLLEAYPVVDSKVINLSNPDYSVDLLIIGGGLAGTTAALWAYDKGVNKDKILLVNKLRHGDSNSMMAEGGTQSADRENDSPARHFLDAIGGGHFTNKPDVLGALAEDAPLIMKWLCDLGAMIDRNDDGTFVETAFGGASRRRMHACRDYTGMEELRVLRDEFRSRQIPCLEFYPVVEFLTDGNRLTGAVLFNLETGDYKIVQSKVVILSTGGFGRLHIRGFPTTNHYGATADGIVMAYRVGAKLRDTDTVQYHPTGAAFPQQIIGLLLTEKLRGMGAQPVNIEGEAFVYPLEPRDVEAASFIRECYVRNKGVVTPTGMKGVWLDTPLIEVKNGSGAIEKAFPGMFRMFKRFDLDIRKDPVLVFPTLHYQNGGIETDPWGKTNIESLLVAGEVSGGVHGKNRLMGNSTLDCLVFGRRAGITASQILNNKLPFGKLTLEHLPKYIAQLKNANINTARKAPIILPDYRGKAVLARMIDVF
ncbi:fumarate reductase [candidate division WOR-3 bacterium RBG_13_43_14]|uniref:Fumarate reductase n=1 Tax=candidate division WOR-3 bacterium RBG_13_43_14 TaxID=1802590 RepID=A0A1F4U545_UNCW3|nr:MAG: fumarate reductase [candidate division WOR-3 bacterium RBG_13_43_14]